MAKNKFSVSDLDSLLSDAMATTNSVSSQLSQDSQLVPESQVSPQIANMVNQKTGQSVDFSRVYRELQKLIQNGNIALQIIQAQDPDTLGDVSSSVSQLMNAIKGCISQFTKIHLQHIKFQQTLQLMKVKHDMKMEEIEKRNQVFRSRDNNGPIDVVEQKKGEGGNVLVPWNTEQISNYMQYLNNKKQGA